MPPYMLVHTPHPFAGIILMAVIWIVELIIAGLIWRDAKEQKMLAPVWGLLAIIPMFGFLVDLIYLILRELRLFHTVDKTTASL